MEFKVKLQLNDYIKANYLHNKSSIVNFCFLSILGSAIIAGMILKSMTDLYFPFAENLLIGGFVFLALFFTITFLNIQLFSRISWRKHKSIKDEMLFNIDESGISAKSQCFESKILWNTFIGYKENKHLIMLYHSFNLFTIIPKRQLESQDKADEIINYLKQYSIKKLSFSRLTKFILLVIIPVMIFLTGGIVFYNEKMSQEINIFNNSNKIIKTVEAGFDNNKIFFEDISQYKTKTKKIKVNRPSSFNIKIIFSDETMIEKKDVGYIAPNDSSRNCFYIKDNKVELQQFYF